jgi:hypothetical protein
MAMKKIILSFLVLTSMHSHAYAENLVFNTLKSNRAKINIPEYSLEEKQLVLSQAKLILEQMYVHQDVKTKDFGIEADPTASLNQIQAQIEKLSTMEFQKKLSDIFYRIRDLHTLYFLPKPFACYSTLLPFILKEVKTPDGKRVIAISEVGDNPDVIKYMPKPFLVKAGDIVTKYDDENIETVIQRQMPRSLGANPDASRRYSLSQIQFKEHSLEFLPEKNNVKLELKNSEGKIYNVNVPWISRADTDCLAEEQTPELLKAPQIRIKKFVLPIIKKKHSKTIGMAKLEEGHTEEPVLYWQINRNQFGNFGYIQLSSFTPDVLTVEQVITKVKEILLQDEMKKTDGLVFEMRGNTGGQLPLAERLIQFFSPRTVHPELFYLKNSLANSYYLNTLFIDDPFTALINEAKAKDLPFTTMYPITNLEKLNDQGQFYFKPIAIFTDSNCYSSCEAFSALMQDNQLGTIFGEDSTTGGGGANTYGLNEILEDFRNGTDTGPFQKLPHGQNITFAWREAVRGGINQGKRIENEGVKSDRISFPSMSDIFNATNDQLLVLHQFLKEESPKYTSQIYLQNEDRQDLILNSKPAFKANWKNTNSVEFTIADKIIETREIPLDGQNTFFQYPSVVDTKSISQGRVEMSGLKDNKNVWRKILNYRIVPKFKLINADWSIDLKNPGDVVTYTTNTLAKDGWNISNDSLYLGNGSGYADDTNAEASLFVKLSKKNYKLSFNAIIDTEDTDILSVLAISEGVTTVLFDKLSGPSIPADKYEVSLEKFANKNVEIRFVFNSDPEYTLKGITITDLKISQQ